MNKKITICLTALIFFALTGSAFARTRVSINIGFGSGYYYRPAPVIVAPAPVVVAPAPVVYYPAYYYRPAYRPVYRPAYCAPAYRHHQHRGNRNHHRGR